MTEKDGLYNGWDLVSVSLHSEPASTKNLPSLMSLWTDLFPFICLLASFSEEFFYDISSHLVCTNIIFGRDWSKWLILFYFSSMLALRTGNWDDILQSQLSGNAKTYMYQIFIMYWDNLTHLFGQRVIIIHFELRTIRKYLNWVFFQPSKVQGIKFV